MALDDTESLDKYLMKDKEGRVPIRNKLEYENRKIAMNVPNEDGDCLGGPLPLSYMFDISPDPCI